MLGVIVVVGSGRFGLELFPRVDAGRFQIRIRVVAGTRYETQKLAIAALEKVNKYVGRDQVEISIGYVGLIPSSYHQCHPPVDRRAQEAILRVALREGVD